MGRTPQGAWPYCPLCACCSNLTISLE
jgi:hypothetical protein